MWLASGSTIGIGADRLGEAEGLGQVERHDRRPFAGADMREQHDHRVRFQRRPAVHAGPGQVLVDDAAVLHVGRQQAERHAGRPPPRSPLSRSRVAVAGRGDQLIALGIERHAVTRPERLVVEIGDAGIDLEIFEQRQHLDRGARQDREGDARMLARGTASSAAAPWRARSGSRRSADGRTGRAAARSHLLAHGARHRRRCGAPIRARARPPASAPGSASRAGPACTPSGSSSCLMPADSVGCVTPSVAAARPKCRSLASAMKNSSRSIIALKGSQTSPERKPCGTAARHLPGRSCDLGDKPRRSASHGDPPTRSNCHKLRPSARGRRRGRAAEARRLAGARCAGQPARGGVRAHCAAGAQRLRPAGRAGLGDRCPPAVVQILRWAERRRSRTQGDLLPLHDRRARGRGGRGCPSRDPRFAGNRHVADQPFVRFYAGVPLGDP